MTVISSERWEERLSFVLDIVIVMLFSVVVSTNTHRYKLWTFSRIWANFVGVMLAYCKRLGGSIRLQH